MAISMFGRYGSSATTPDASYPHGTFKDKNGGQPGTPLQHDWARDKDGFFQKLLYDARMAPLGSDDTAVFSQYLHALRYQFGKTTKPPTWSMQDVCAGLYMTYDITRPDAPPNILSTGLTIRDACVGVSLNTQLPILYVLTSNDTVLPVTGPMIYDVPVAGSALDLEFSAGAMESVRSICSDGDYLYVLWRTTSNNYWVTAFYMQISGDPVPVWNKDLAMDYSTYEEYSKIIVANASYLAISSDNISGNCGVAIVPRTGGSCVKGFGNGFSGPESASNGRIVSDGTHVFWLTRVTGSGSCEAHLCSAKISDPTTSDYTGGVVYANADPRLIPSALYNYGGSSGTVICFTPRGSSYLLVKNEDETKYCMTIENHDWYADVQDYNIVSGCDGYNLWLQLHQQSDVYDTARLAFAKIPLTQFVKSNTSTSQQDYTASMVLTNLSVGITTGDEPGRLLFDGVDMWFISRSGFLCRIANPGLR
jgi:hypothetical protein